MRQGVAQKNDPLFPIFVNALWRSGTSYRSRFTTDCWELQDDEDPPRITEDQKNNQVQVQAFSFVALLVSHTPIFHGSLELLMDPFFIKMSKHTLISLIP